MYESFSEKLIKEYIPGKPHIPTNTLPLYAFRSRLIQLLARLDFYVLHKKRFQKKSDRRIEEEVFEESTLGFQMQQDFLAQGHHIIGGKEFHDVLHSILGVNLDTEGEALLQAFLLGNNSVGSYTYAFLLLNVIVLPETFSQLKHAYELGQLFKRVRHIDMQPYLSRHKEDLWDALRK